MDCNDSRDYTECKDCNEICNCGMCPKERECACTCKYEFNVKDMPNNNANEATMEELKEQLKCYRFAIIELGLYLDTHPEDEKALCLHRHYANVLKELSFSQSKLLIALYNPINPSCTISSFSAPTMKYLLTFILTTSLYLFIIYSRAFLLRKGLPGAGREPEGGRGASLGI